MAEPLPHPAAWLWHLLPTHPREPLHDGFVECAVEGFYLIWTTGYENNLFSKQDDLF